MVDCASLENWRAERFRGFESHPLRHLNPLQLKGCSVKTNENGASPKSTNKDLLLVIQAVYRHESPQ